MKIKTKLLLGSILSIVTMILIAKVLLYERTQDDNVTSKGRIAEQLVKGVFEMNILIYDYRIYKGQIRERARAQWQSRFASISTLLAILESSIGPDSLREKALIGELSDNINTINILFKDMEAIDGRMSETGRLDDVLSSEMKDRIFSQIMGRSHTIVSLSSQLCDTNYKTLDKIHDRSHILIFISITSLMLFVIIFSWLINRGIGRPIVRINMGLENLGKGNLDYKIGIAGDNEISQMANSIEMMAAKLRETTVSRDILTAEIEQRIKIANRFKRLSEAATEGIAISDKGRFVDVNKQFARMFGYTIDEVKGMSVTDLIVPHERDRVRDLISSGYEQPYETVGLRKDATTLDLLVSGKMLAVEGSHMRITAVSDITDLKTVQNELELKTYNLDRLNKNLEGLVKDKVNELRQKEQMLIQQSKMAAMGEMMAAVAHQWKQPLNALAIMIQDIKDAYQYGEIDEAYIDNTVKSTMAQVNFMSRTINEFRDFFKVAPQTTVVMQPPPLFGFVGTWVVVLVVEDQPIP
ncbi:MAG: PAS domain S-box protein, partial [Nitrospirae bacterium]|nr:PAS domain S-box protein [Nitrospirota bacterium]